MLRFLHALKQFSAARSRVRTVPMYKPLGSTLPLNDKQFMYQVAASS